MNKQQPETRKKTEQAIKDAFWQLYCEKRIEKITVKDIVTLAGYNRSTFYTYFLDVYDVLDKIEADVMPGKEFIPPLMTVSESATTGMLEDFFKGLIDFYEERHKYFSVLLSDQGDPAFASKMNRVFKNMMLETIKGQVPVPEQVLDYMLEFYVGGTITVIKHWYDQDKNIPIDKLLNILYGVMGSQNLT